MPNIKNVLIALSIFGSTMYGMTLDDVVSKALGKNPSLEAIAHRITANKSEITISKQFANPVVSYTQNSISNSQAMSQKTVTFQQKLPYFGKRDSLEKIAISQEEILNETLQEAKVRLVNEIKDQAYTIWEFQHLYNIIIDYEELTKQNIELFESYTSTTDNQHMGIMSAELTLSDLRIQKSILESKIKSAYARLSYLAAFEIKDLKIDISIKEMGNATLLEKKLANNKSLSVREKEIEKSQAVVKNAELNRYPDVNLIGGYSYRENFNNYWTVGVGVSLPIYGTEEYKEEEARVLTLSAQSLKEDVKIAVDSQFKSAFLQMKSAYEIYHIVHDVALPQVQHMFELTSSSISTGGDLFKFIDILVQKLKLEQKSITAVANYNRAEAKISALSGELK